jgi:hypothetical protein
MERGSKSLSLTGAVSPRPKKITLQKLNGSSWTLVGYGTTDERGRYALQVDSTGTYRVLANGGVGPVVRVR